MEFKFGGLKAKGLAVCREMKTSCGILLLEMLLLDVFSLQTLHYFFHVLLLIKKRRIINKKKALDKNAKDNTHILEADIYYITNNLL